MAFTFDEVFINNGQLVIANQDINFVFLKLNS